MRAGSGFWMVLDRKADKVAATAELQAFDDVIVEADVTDGDRAIGRPRFVPIRGYHRKTVVVCRDLNFSSGVVEDGLVDAAVTKLQLVGVEAEGASEELVAEADAEEGNLRPQNVLQ